jgi:hypothetical protein
MPETSGDDRRPLDMSVAPLTCADVEARDLESAYLADRLSPDDASAYESHYFACDRCWTSLRLATEARAAFAAPFAAPRPAHRWRAWGLASAATLVIAVGGVMLGRRDAPVADGTLRGPVAVLTIHSSLVGDTLAVVWTAPPDADRYRVRLFRADGVVLVEREIGDTSLSIPLASLDPAARSAALYWQVQAFDRMRLPLAGSALVPTAPASPP